MPTDPIKARIQSLVPEILEEVIIGRPVGLADVLRAMQPQVKYYVGCDGYFYDWNDDGLICLDVKWNLSTDYEGQSDECKRFIGELLGVKSKS